MPEASRDSAAALDESRVEVQFADDRAVRSVAMNISADGLRFHSDDWERVLHVSELDGVTLSDRGVRLHTNVAGVVQLAGMSTAESLRDLLETSVCAVPEATLALRGLGSSRRGAGSEHDRYFSPLLTAKRKATAAPGATSRLNAFNVAQMRSTLDATLAEFAAVRFPRQPSEHRAYSQALRELVEPVHAALLQLEGAARAVADAPDETRIAAWREWCRALSAAFVAADSAWLRISRLLASVPPPKPTLWQRLRNRKKRED